MSDGCHLISKMQRLLIEYKIRHAHTLGRLYVQLSQPQKMKNELRVPSDRYQA